MRSSNDGPQLLLCLLLLLPSVWLVRLPNRVTIQIGILLPNNRSKDCFINKTLPSIDIAIQKMEKRYRYMRFVKNVNNSQEHEEDYSTGPLNAIDMFVNRRAHVLLGPVEPFNLGSICRYSTARYKVPVISPGGWAPGLDDKIEFGMLTRSMGTYSNLGDLFISIMSHFKWPPRNFYNVAMIEKRAYEYQFITDAIYRPLTGNISGGHPYKVWRVRSDKDFTKFDVKFHLQEVSKKSRSELRGALSSRYSLPPVAL